jgi:hypothetical protein
MATSQFSDFEYPIKSWLCLFRHLLVQALFYCLYMVDMVSLVAMISLVAIFSLAPMVSIFSIFCITSIVFS